MPSIRKKAPTQLRPGAQDRGGERGLGVQCPPRGFQEGRGLRPGASTRVDVHQGAPVVP